MLELIDLWVGYGAIQALRGIQLKVEAGQIVTLIGANGAGKSTTLRAISGLRPPQKGKILFLGQDISRLPPHEIVKLGISQAPEGRGVFPDLSVNDNLELGAFLRRDKAGIAQDLERCFKLFPRLLERRGQMAGTLSGGEQQMLAISRALMSRPKLLLLDEPSLGLAPQIVDVIFDIIKEINQAGTTILLVEQNAARALDVSHRGYVLETGEIVLSGEAKELLASDQVRKAYLGH
ncbi:MAG: ABC transporter ATP-binding protein [Myxococcota bacterium]